MATCIFKNYIGGETDPSNSSGCVLTGEAVLCGPDVPLGGTTIGIEVPVTFTDGIIDIKRNVTNAMRAAALAQQGLTISAMDCIVPNMDRGIV